MNIVDALDCDKIFSHIFLTFQDYLEYKKERGKMLIDRTNSLLLPFAFWGDPPEREPGNLYELRSYHLRVRDFILYIQTTFKTKTFKTKAQNRIACMHFSHSPK